MNNAPIPYSLFCSLGNGSQELLQLKGSVENSTELATLRHWCTNQLEFVAIRSSFPVTSSPSSVITFVHSHLITLVSSYIFPLFLIMAFAKPFIYLPIMHFQRSTCILHYSQSGIFWVLVRYSHSRIPYKDSKYSRFKQLLTWLLQIQVFWLQYGLLHLTLRKSSKDWQVIIDIHKTQIQEFRSLMPGTCVVTAVFLTSSWLIRLIAGSIIT